MRRAIFAGALIAAAIATPAARADYAVLRSGARLHVTGYELDGDRVAPGDVEGFGLDLRRFVDLG